MKRISTLALITLFSVALSPVALLADDCDFTAEREAMVDMDGAESVEIFAKAGSLEVLGKKGLQRAEISGTACASDADMLEETIIRTRRAGSRLIIEAEVAEGSWGWRSSSARLDLRVHVPAGIPVEIDDGSGSIEVRGTGSLTIDDGSGSLRVEDIEGDVQIDDGSGELFVRNVRGDVEIDDGSGSIELADVTGSVEIEDGSGEIDIERIAANVRVRDGSGSINVRQITGDFVVADDGSGGIHHRDVAGRVDIPTDD